MNKKIIIFYFIIEILLYSNDKIKIGISTPFVKNIDVSTLFYQTQFLFEFLANYDYDKYTIELINSNGEEDEYKYQNNCKDESINNEFDYLLYSIAYSNNNNIFFKVSLINPYNDIIIFTKLFIVENDFSINESLTRNCNEIIEKIKITNLSKTATKKNIIKKQKKNNLDEESIKREYRNEIYFLNGFLKNHPLIMSYLSLYSGYNFFIFKYFGIGTGLFLGTGYIEKKFDFNLNIFKNFYVGGFFLVNAFFSGSFVEPGISLRFEFSYILNHSVILSIPFDIGIRIILSKTNVLKINSSFQFCYYDFYKNKWYDSWTIGIMVGYGKKI